MDIPKLVEQSADESDGPSSGIPYSASEVLLASRQPPDIYHRHLMAWAGNRIFELEKHCERLEQMLEDEKGTE